MGQWKRFSCAIMPSVSGTDQYCFKGKRGCVDILMFELLRGLQIFIIFCNININKTVCSFLTAAQE